MKYPLRMARPRQWKKKFVNIHDELKAAHSNYSKRYNAKASNMAMARRYGKNKRNVHKTIGYGKYRLLPTRGIAYGFKRKAVHVYGGRKTWRRKGSNGVVYRSR